MLASTTKKQWETATILKQFLLKAADVTDKNCFFRVMFQIQSEDHSRLYADVEIIKDVSYTQVQEGGMRKKLLYKYRINYFGPYLVHFSSNA